MTQPGSGVGQVVVKDMRSLQEMIVSRLGWGWGVCVLRRRVYILGGGRVGAETELLVV